jgi:CubicO group peptidase (beta-lactamase class C family)
VLDLARFDIALDEGRLLRPESVERMFTPARSSSGEALPYALGWFVETIGGRTVCWHYGFLPPSVSALYVKVPEARLSFVLLANNDGLSRGLAWTAEGLRASPFARAFLAAFELPGG